MDGQRMANQCRKLVPHNDIKGDIEPRLRYPKAGIPLYQGPVPLVYRQLGLRDGRTVYK